MCIVYCDICHCRLYSLQNHSEHFVMRNTLAANAGACLSPKGEFTQEYVRIRYVHQTETATRYHRGMPEKQVKDQLSDDRKATAIPSTS